jgi:hypothetical protein
MTSGGFAVHRARFPKEYGARGGAEHTPLPWDFVEERLRAARNYWLSTISADGSPHARPVDGIWVLGALCFGGSGEARWARNLRANPALSVSLPSEEEAIILEGVAEWITDPSDPLGPAQIAPSMEKYPEYFKEGAPLDTKEFQPFWCLRPRVVYAWTLQGFPNRATKWTFDRAGAGGGGNA